jgi:rhodanese-related sulfurtransferase
VSGGVPHPHSPGFLALVEDARRRVKTMSIEEYQASRERGETPVLVDVREDREWDAGHLPGALHLGKGIIERDIEAVVPDPATPVVLYCGGGFRSVLVCENLQRMGYSNCISLDGGWKGWNALGLPVETPGPDGGSR